jgi:hypothetical protein
MIGTLYARLCMMIVTRARGFDGKRIEGEVMALWLCDVGGVCMMALTMVYVANLGIRMLLYINCRMEFHILNPTNFFLRDIVCYRYFNLLSYYQTILDHNIAS